MKFPLKKRKTDYFLIFDSKHRLWVLVRTEAKNKKIKYTLAKLQTPVFLYNSGV